MKKLLLLAIIAISFASCKEERPANSIEISYQFNTTKDTVDVQGYTFLNLNKGDLFVIEGGYSRTLASGVKTYRLLK